MANPPAGAPNGAGQQLTVAQKAALASGATFWTTKALGGLRSVRVSDGPHGLRKEASDRDGPGSPAQPATCFPPAAGLAQSWDPALARRLGAALAAECRAQGVHVLLGPGINIKRSPLGGRNFEYFSEDPYLTAAMATGWVAGLQAGGVGASLKHFAANSAETDRMRVSSDIDPRPLREIYLRAFQKVVRDARPWTVMCSYNQLNGVPASQSHFLLTQVLREEWGFAGLVMSDWGAVSDRAAAVAAGLDLTMPFPGDASDAALAAAVTAGEADEAALDRAVARLTELARLASRPPRPAPAVDYDAHHALAREAAARSIVLLQNDGGLLPLAPGGTLAVIGELAVRPRIQGGGSSRVTPARLDVPLEALRAAAGPGRVRYAPGFTLDGSGDPAQLAAEAAATARACDAAVLFLGLPEAAESEGFDRTTIDLPAQQLALARQVAAASPRTAVVVAHGGVVRLGELAATVPAILDGALAGQAAGGAIADVLFGAVSPSGRLAETVPARIQDTAAYLDFPGEHGHARYGEGIFVGYRWHDARQVEPTFPFGHGLSYTTFCYRGLRLAASAGGIEVTLTVTNAGQRAGREVVQVYAGLPGSAVARPPRQLAGFGSVDLAPGQSREVTIMVRSDDLAYWDHRAGRFVVEGGEYQVWAGASSRDLRLRGQVTLAGDEPRLPLTLDSTIAEVLADPAGGPALGEALGALLPAPGNGDADGSGLGTDLAAMLGAFPVGRLNSLSGGKLTTQQVEQLLAAVNKQHGKGGPASPVQG